MAGRGEHPVTAPPPALGDLTCRRCNLAGGQHTTAAVPDGVLAFGRWLHDDECGCTSPLCLEASCAEAARHLEELARAGFVLVRGPVETEWSNVWPDGERYPRLDETEARQVATEVGLAVEHRQVAAWRPAPDGGLSDGGGESTQDGACDG